MTGHVVRDTSGHVRGTTGRTTPPYKGVVRLSGVPHLPQQTTTIDQRIESMAPGCNGSSAEIPKAGPTARKDAAESRVF